MRLSAYLVPLLTALLAACAGDAPPPADAAAAPPTDGDERLGRADAARIKGNAAAPVWIVEVSDFQCPFCRQWQMETAPQLEREYIATGRARLAYVNLPIQTHRHALLAAEASMCAGAQSRFWQLHDAIFATQTRWAPLGDARPTFDSLAAAAGVDMAAWRACVDGHVMRPLIQSDYERSVQNGATSTPTFIIMGDTTIPGARPSMLVGAQPIENFRTAIDALLAQRSGPTPDRE